MNDMTQRKTVDLARGLFLIRYNTADDELSPPRVRIFPEPSSASNCEIVISPDSTDGVLWSPPSGLVVVVEQPSRLIVEVTAQSYGGSTAANVKIEPLSPGRPPPLRPSMRAPVSEPAEASLHDFQILAHVAGIGDTLEGLNAWIAGPAAPARIEGLCLLWPGKPVDLNINYAVRFARPQQGDNQFVPLGTFAGTRGRALPLTGVALEASGPAASRYSLAVEAIFLGAPAIRVTGQRINLVGPSGREPLVGIKINLEPLSVQTIETPLEPVPVQRSGGRVRVFRSRQSTAKPVG